MNSLQFTAFFIAYCLAGKLGQATTSIRSSNLGPVWPAYGIALAAFLQCGYRIWPVIATAAFVVAFTSPVPHLAALGQAAAATFAAFTGTFLLHHVSKFDNSLSRLRDAVALIVLGALGSSLVSASIGTSVLYATRVHAYSGLPSAWLIYWLGDATGALLVTALVLTLPEFLRIWDRHQVREFVILLLLLFLVCFIMFGGALIPGAVRVLAFAVLPFVMWAAIRFGVSGATLSVLVIATIATMETASGSGPFATNGPFVNAVLLDIFFVVLSVTGLTLAAAIKERGQAEIEREKVLQQQAAMEALSGMSRKLIEAQEQERSRIGGELHDDINQRLAMLALELEQLADDPSEVGSRLRSLREQATEISNDVQALSHELHSSKLEYLGVVAGIRSWCKEFSERQKMKIDFKTDVSSALTFEVGVCLFRVVQEGLHNAVKHSGVKQVEVRLSEQQNEVHLIIADRGSGFDVEAAMQGKGLGLTSMQERVRLVNGTIAIDSKPMRGTTISVCVPLRSECSARDAA